VSGGVSTAAASTETFNPFDINNGFTTVAQGNIALNNGEIEGSVAAFGSISSGNQNGYPVIHSAAGEPDYTVPSVDGTPVRILASAFTGSGSFDLSDRDDSGTISPDSPEAKAVVKFVSTDGIQGSERGNFLRLTNSDAGNIDLKAVPFAGSDVADYQTAQSSIAAYFPDIDTHVARTNQCLASMYDPSGGLTHAVDLNEQGGMAFPSGFATDRPNVIDYADIAGKTIKMDNADGYAPTADAPLVIRVADGTTSIGQLNFEGWSPQKGAQQTFARDILLDMAEVSGDVTIDGLAMGAIWAPKASLHFNSGITTNGQWFAGGDITSAGGGEIHHHSFLGNLPCGDQSTVPDGPSMGSSVGVDGSVEKVLPLAGGTVIDTVVYEGLTPGVTYALKGEIRTALAGAETGIAATAEFTPQAASGTTTVTFKITAEQVAGYAGQDLVVFEYLSLNGDLVVEHTDPKNEAQTFTVAEEAPTVPVDPTGPKDPDGSAHPKDPQHSGAAQDDLVQTGAPDDDLAQTGASGIWSLLAGGALLLAGGSTLLLRRRKMHA
jgi:choice-of-anchor A domain-containing protein/LPXTG-motif cell wall-anchored protein